MSILEITRNLDIDGRFFVIKFIDFIYFMKILTLMDDFASNISLISIISEKILTLMDDFD